MIVLVHYLLEHWFKVCRNIGSLAHVILLALVGLLVRLKLLVLCIDGFIGLLVHGFTGSLLRWNFDFCGTLFWLSFYWNIGSDMLSSGLLVHWYTGSLFVLVVGTLVLLVHLMIHLNIYWITGSKVQQRQICIGL